MKIVVELLPPDDDEFTQFARAVVSGADEEDFERVQEDLHVRYPQGGANLITRGSATFTGPSLTWTVWRDAEHRPRTDAAPTWFDAPQRGRLN